MTKIQIKIISSINKEDFETSTTKLHNTPNQKVIKTEYHITGGNGYPTQYIGIFTTLQK